MSSEVQSCTKHINQLPVNQVSRSVDWHLRKQMKRRVDNQVSAIDKDEGGASGEPRNDRADSGRVGYAGGTVQLASDHRWRES